MAEQNNEEEGSDDPKMLAFNARLTKLQGSAAFIKNVIQTYGRQLDEGQCRKLQYLISMLESNMSNSTLYRRYPGLKLDKLEGVINKLKSKFKTLLHDEVIVINDGTEQSDETSASVQAADAGTTKQSDAAALLSQKSPLAARKIPKTSGPATTTKPAATERRSQPIAIQSAKTSEVFERRSTPGKTAAKPAAPVNTVLSLSPTSSPDTRSQSTKSSSSVTDFDLTPTIGTRREVFVRRSNTPAPELLIPTTGSRPDASTSSEIFERRSNPTANAPKPLAAAESTNGAQEKASLEEARKKLAALSALREAAASANAARPLASNCKDPRGRKSAYLNPSPPTVSVPVPGQAVHSSWSHTDSVYTSPAHIQAFSVSSSSSPSSLSVSPPPPPPSMHIKPRAAGSNAHNIPFVPTIRPQAPQLIPNLGKQAAEFKLTPTAAAAVNELNESIQRRNNNLPSSAELRDPRTMIWINPNNINVPIQPAGIQQQQQQQQQQKQQQQPQQQQLQQQNQQPAGAAAPIPVTNHLNLGQPRREAPYQNASYQGFEESQNWKSPHSGNNNNVNNMNNNNNINNNSNNNYSNNNNIASWSKNQNNNNNAYTNSNSSFSHRGGFNRGGGHGSNHRFSQPSSVHERPKSYREHRLAKAAALAKENEEKQRLLAAAEKQRQMDEEASKAPTPAVVPEKDNLQLDTSYRSVVELDNVRKINFKIPKKSTGSDKSSEKSKAEASGQTTDKTNKPKDNPKTAICDETDKSKNSGTDKQLNPPPMGSKKCNSEVNKSSEANKSEKSDKVKQVSTVDKVNKKDKADNTKQKDKKQKTSDKTDKTEKQKNKHSAEKLHKPRKSSEKSHKKKTDDTDKNNSEQKQDECESAKKLKEKHLEEKDSNKLDNLENEPPSQPVKPKTTMVETEEQQEPRRTKEKAKSKEKSIEPEDPKENGTSSENELLATNVNEGVVEQREKSLPKLPKIKVVLGPNAHTITVMPTDTKNDAKAEDLPKTVSRELPPSPKRKMKRRQTMVPTASESLVDKSELFTGSSFMYEDIVEHQRQQQRKNNEDHTELEADANQRSIKNLANMFEKTNDNCSISTHNILAGKRRTRFVPPTLNETELSRTVFNLAPRVKLKPKKAAPVTPTAPVAPAASVSPAAPAAVPAVKRKRGRPAYKHLEKEKKNEPQQQQEQLEEEELPAAKRVCPNTEPVDKPTTVPMSTSDLKDESTNTLSSVDVSLPPPRTKRTKRNRTELDKLTEDIAQMYYAEDVMRATGRRTCTLQQPQQTVAESSCSNSNSTLPSRNNSLSSSCTSFANNAEFAPYKRNVARRGRSISGVASGLDRASFNAQQQQKLKTKRFRIKIKVCKQLLEMLTKAKTSSCTSLEVKNINTDWHANASMTSCVVCSEVLSHPMIHYAQHHEEFYFARLPPGMLQKLRAGLENVPVYAYNENPRKFYHVCPFCGLATKKTNREWVEHISRHTGEANYQCSRCKTPRSRPNKIKSHVAHCGGGARVLFTHNFSARVPIKLHVCHLCEFVQLSRKNLECHYQLQHGHKASSVTGLGEEVIIYDTDDTPLVDTEKEAQALLKKHEALKKTNQVISKPNTKLEQKKKAQINPNQSPAKNAKKSKAEQQKLEQMTKAEPDVNVGEDILVEDELVEAAVESDEIINGLGTPPPESEPLLVLNECKFEIEESQQELEFQEEVVQEPIEQAQLELEINSQQETQGEEEQQEGQEVEEQQEGQEVEEQQEGQEEEEQQETQELEEQQEEEEQQEIIDGTEQLESNQSDAEMDPEMPATKKSGKCNGLVRPKSIFHNFHKFCNKLKSNNATTTTITSPTTCTTTTTTPTTTTSNAEVGEEVVGDSITSEKQSESPTSNDVPTSSPKTLETPSPTVTSPMRTVTPQAGLITVENVAFHMRAPMTQQPAYYCTYAGCKFLFSNEVEGLENHIKREHPHISWSGKCVCCAQHEPINGAEQLSVSDELRHMIRHQLETAAASAVVVVNPAPAAPEPVLPKLRVRRFTGDRLATEPEQQVPVPVEEEQDTAEKNAMLRSLLDAESRPPCLQPQQQLQQSINAISDEHEYVCETPTTNDAVTIPSTNPPLLASVPNARVVNHPSELGLAINQVFSLAVAPSPQKVASETVPLPAASNSDFLLTQSVTQNGNGSAPAQINISIQPHHIPQQNPAASTHPSLSNRAKNLVADRFRCMALNCNFCAHTVMCIREHMKFHCYSFGVKDYLQCAYCSHVGVDVNDFVRHGVIEHGLASRSELQNLDTPTTSLTVINGSTPTTTTVAPTSYTLTVTDRIRDLLVNRPAMSIAGGLAPAAVAPATVAATESTQQTDVPLTTVIKDLLAATGFPDKKVYACPFKPCPVSLTEETFGNHVLYHKSSNPNIGAITCKFCRQVFDVPGALRAHLHQMHSRHKYFCSVCLATTPNRRLMHHHMSKQHDKMYSQVHNQQEFLELPASLPMYRNVPLEDLSNASKCWVSVIEENFATKKLEEFSNKLLVEWQQRRQETKRFYHPSEYRLLPRIANFTTTLGCAQCQFRADEYTPLNSHLLHHLEQAVREAYQSDQEDQETQPIVASQPKTNEPLTAAVCRPEMSEPGTHVPRSCKWQYVPKEKRYICCASNCGTHFFTEQALRDHLTKQHTYAESFRCPHCFVEDRITSIDRLIEHLSCHKQYIYQCGMCATFNPKRSFIERHIHERHGEQNIDIVMIKRNVAGNGSNEMRWLKSMTSLRAAGDMRLCNLCNTLQDNNVNISQHMEQMHGRKLQYSCSHCAMEDNDVANVVSHMLAKHREQRIQPTMNYHRLLAKNKQTLAFYCNTCWLAASSYQRMRAHCAEKHSSSFQFECPHCPFGHALERMVIQHLRNLHPVKKGLAKMQFERVAHEMLDSQCWETAHHLERTINLTSEGSPETSTISSDSSSSSSSVYSEPMDNDVIDLLSSDEEGETDYGKLEFSCSHCTLMSRDVVALRTKHWAKEHADLPFYFSAQPQLRCPACCTYVSNSKALLEEHLPQLHSVRKMVACDKRQSNECAFCRYQYSSFSDLCQHIESEAHLSNDLKYLKDDALDKLLLLGTAQKHCPNEYYQCNMCRVIMPTNVAMAQHGRIEHSTSPERFCFRQIKDQVTHHCSFCMFASTVEMEAMRHMLDHYKKFEVCVFCRSQQSNGFDDYIQHYYTNHREELHRFKQVHPFAELRKFLMQILYQFPNGLIISKSSLRQTRFRSEFNIRQLYGEVVRKSQQPPIPRIVISQLLNRSVVPTKIQAQKPTATATAPPRITIRRKTLNPDDINPAHRSNTQEPTVTILNKITGRRTSIVDWHTSFTGSSTSSATVVPIVAAPSITASSTTPILQRIAKRRKTVVDNPTSEYVKRFCTEGSNNI